MKPSTLGALVLIVGGLVATWRPTAPGSDPIPAPPEAATRAIVGPVSQALGGHPEEARQLAAFYHAAAEAIRRDGSGAKVVKTTADLRTFCTAAVTLRFQEVFAKVPGLAEAIHGPEGAMAKLLGLDVVELDHAGAAAALDAVAWACGEAAR
ncbi:MAG: hypothetical protein JXB62_06680 [Pirellulales bacterium]|nr:hypothetical protein [Pirellulales bacterium]